MIQNVAVIGAGTMGNGIAHLFAQNGFSVRLIDVNEKQLEKAIQTISKNLDRQISKGTVTEEQKKNTLGNIQTQNELSKGVKDCQLIIEAATENVELKLKIFKQLSESVSDTTILATNTASISITKIASASAHPEMVI